MTWFSKKGDKNFKTSFTTIQKFTTFEIITKENSIVLPLLSLTKGMLTCPVIRGADFEFNSMFPD